MTATKPFPCPACSMSRVVDHCDSQDCGWLKCSNRACMAVLDRLRRKGFRQRRGGVFEHFAFGALGNSGSP